MAQLKSIEQGSVMKISIFNVMQSQPVIGLFTHVFTNSEGEDEGKLIGSLVSNLITTTDARDLIGFVAFSEETIVGSIFFSRLLLPNQQVAFILSPVAIATLEQSKGLGQKLITFGIEHLRSLGVDLLFTYGDPNFYSKVGFQKISENTVKAPLKLSYPEGWLAQSLSGDSIEPMNGSSLCVGALNDQQYW